MVRRAMSGVMVWAAALLFLLMLQSGAVEASPNQDQIFLDEQVVLWERVSDARLSPEQRWIAERTLIEADDARMLLTVFRGLAEPIRVVRLVDPNVELVERVVEIDPVGVNASLGMYPSSGRTYGDAELRIPVPVQIAYARGRVWDRLARSAEPESERHAALISCLELAENDVQINAIITAATHNFLPEVRAWILAAYVNPDIQDSTRYRAGNLLAQSMDRMPASEAREVRESLIDAAWRERGSFFATRMGQRLRWSDPRVDALKLDAYLQDRSRFDLVMSGVISDMLRHFSEIGNDHAFRNELENLQRKHTQRLRELRDAAHAAGDDEPVKSYEEQAKIEMQAVRQKWMERIDAWVERNRTRIEERAAELEMQLRPRS